MIIGFSEFAVFLNEAIFDLSFKDSAVKALLTSSAGKSFVHNAFLSGVSLDEHVAIGFKVKSTSN